MTTLTLTIPRDLNDLAKHWQGYVARELRRLGRVKFNAEDVLGYVIMKLVETNVVAKFWAGIGDQNHPLTVSVPEAAGMLGISVPDFLAFQVESDDSLDPVDFKGRPVEGGYTSPKARYLFADVIALSASVTFPNQGTLVMPTPKEPSVAQWKAYLSMAVRNHSSNYTRTFHRRESREHSPAFFRVFRDSDTGDVVFEERLVDEKADLSIEQACGVALLFKQAPGLQTRTSSGGQTFIELLQEGYTIREASKAVGLTRQEQKVLAAHLGG